MRKSTIVILILIINISTLYGQSKIIGVTTSGGEFNQGTIFSTDSTGANLSVLYSFPFVDGTYPSGSLVEYNNKLYGHVVFGIFEYDFINDKYKIKANLIDSTTGKDPTGKLILSNSGYMYCTTRMGGTNGRGCIIKFDPQTNQITTLYNFVDSLGYNSHGDLLIASNNKIYGMTISGGAHNKGVIFEFDETTSTYTKLFDFSGSNDGEAPSGGFIEGSPGILFGMSELGGTNSRGAIFKFNLSTYTFTQLYSFYTGTGAKGNLILNNGKFYGLNSTGGSNSDGELFEYDTIGNTYSIKYDFSSASGTQPMGSLFLGPNNKFYGTTNAGGPNSNGVVFEYDLSANSYSILLKLNTSILHSPTTTPMMASNGKMYVPIDIGGLLEYDFVAAPKMLFYFNASRYGIPNSSLFQAGNGKFYGVTYVGLLNYQSVLYEFDAINSKFKVLHYFYDGLAKEELTEGNDGKLYGAVYDHGSGVSNSDGYVYSFDLTNDSLQIEHPYTAHPDGHYPHGHLKMLPNGKFIGTTDSGGLQDVGTIFQLDPANGNYTSLLDFIPPRAYPNYGLFLSTNGKMYDTDGNSVFEYDYTSNAITHVTIITAVNGVLPRGGLVEVPGGKIYGVTKSGGINYNFGTLFEYDNVLHTVTKKVDFDSTSGGRPEEGLILGGNGKLFGVNREGGLYNSGTLYEYDYATGQLNVLQNFSDSIGRFPIFQLTGYDYNLALGISRPKSNVISVYPNPASDHVTIDFAEQLDKEITLELFSTYGQLIKRYSDIKCNPDCRFTISLENLSNGIYWLRVLDSNKLIRNVSIIKNN